MEEKPNEIVSGQEVAQSNKIDIVYFRPPFYQRVLANLLDVLIMVFLFFSLFLGTRTIVNNTSTYKEKNETLIQMRVDSGIYAYDDNNVLRDIISVLNYDKGQTAKSKCVRSAKAIDQFISYVETVSVPSEIESVKKDYRDYRLSDNMKHEGIAMFVLNESNEVVENPSLIDGAQSVSSNIYTIYFDKAYRPYIDEHVQAMLVTAIPGYKEILQFQTNMLLWVDIFTSYLLAGLLTYLLPLFIFRRGRMTFGKALYGIGLVDKDCLSPKIGRTLARFAIVYIAELVLSLFTFGLPLLISFSMMAFSKNKQGFPDYMLGLQEVDARRTKIYFNFQEVELEKTSTYKKPVEFKTRNFD